MKQARLVIKDAVNIKFEGLEPLTRRRICDTLKFFVPYARNTPLFKMGRWDGNVSFATVGGGTYLNLLDRILPMIYEEGYDIELVDLRPEHHFTFPEIREDMFAHKVWPPGHPIAGEPVLLRDYQVEAIKRYLQHLTCIQSISTGAGKTLLTAALSAIIEPYGRTIIIVPSKSLVEQTEEDYRNLGLDVGVFFGDRKEWDHQHTICTWQSLSVFSKKTRRNQVSITIDDFIKGAICVMVDETHTAQAKELKDLLTGPMAQIPIRLGLTGTVPKEEFQFVSILASIGPVVGEIRAKELQDRGVLAKCHIDIIQLRDDHIDFKEFSDEKEYLLNDKERLTWIAEMCRELGEKGNTLILVDRIEAGRILEDLIPGSIFISGEVKTKDRRKEYKEVATVDNKVIIATYGVAAVGINVPRIFNLVLIEAGKSFTRVIQSIGRGLRTAHDKDFVNIYDICSTAKFSSKHLTERKKDYKAAEYPFVIRKINYFSTKVIDLLAKLMK